MSPDRLIESCKRLGPWFHQIDLGAGVQTRNVAPTAGPQPEDHPLPRWHKIKDALPADMQGMSVLDVGCSDGFFSFEMARRGAEVVGLDIQAAAIARLRWARKRLGLSVDAYTRDIYDLDHGITPRERLRHRFQQLRWALQGTPAEERHYIARRFDLVFMFALLYHLKAPLQALEQVAGFADVLILETIAMDDEVNSHLLYQPPIPRGSNKPKWFPTTRCVKDMLHWVGYRNVVEIAGPQDMRPIYLAYKQGADLSRWRLPGR